MRISFSDERTKLDALVRPGSLSDELRHADLVDKAAREEAQEDPRMAYLTVVTYPALIAATPSGSLVIDGEERAWPPTLQDMLDMSNDALNVWYDEVRRLNPDWLPDVETLVKKALEMTATNSTTTSSTESSD